MDSAWDSTKFIANEMHAKGVEEVVASELLSRASAAKLVGECMVYSVRKCTLNFQFVCCLDGLRTIANHDSHGTVSTM